jgi:hypothetical protein
VTTSRVMSIPGARVLVLGAGMAAVAVAAVTAAGAAGASSPTLIASKHVAGLPTVTLGKSINLSGHESEAGSQSFALQAATFPFTSGFHTVASGTTTGSYSVAVKPTHATRYRVIVGGSTSPTVTVYVLDRTLSSSCNLCRPANSPGTHTLILKAKLQTPPGLVAVKGPVYFYYALNNSSVPPSAMHLVKTVPLHITGHRLSLTISYTVHFPITVFEFAETYCWKDNESKDGVGLPGHHHCGDPTVRRGEYLG